LRERSKWTGCKERKTALRWKGGSILGYLLMTLNQHASSGVGGKEVKPSGSADTNTHRKNIANHQFPVK
jgi:hypothetical protein